MRAASALLNSHQRSEMPSGFAGKRSELRLLALWVHWPKAGWSIRLVLLGAFLQRTQERKECLLIFGAQFAEAIPYVFGLAAVAFDGAF